MKVLIYLLVPVLVVLVWSTAMWARNRKPTSLQSGVDSFRREMRALSPDGPEPRRRPARPPSGAGRPRQGGGPPGGAAPARRPNPPRPRP